MMRSVTLGVGALAVLLSTLGCRTATTAGRPTAKSAPAAVPAMAQPAVDTRSPEQRAEAEAHFMAGISHELNDAPEAALDDFYQAAQADPGNEPLVLDLSTRFILLKRHDKALALLNKALEQPGASAALDARLGFVQLQMGKTNAAIRSNQNAIRKAPRSILGYQSLFQIYLQSGKTNETRHIIEEAAKVPKPDAEFLVELSEMCFYQGRLEKGASDQYKARAREALTRAAELKPDNFFVLQKMADGFTQTGDRKQAAAILLKIQNLYPELPSIRERLVNLFLHDQDKKNAADQLEALIRENPTDPQAYYLLGIIAFDDRRYKEAADYFRKAILLKPDLEPAYYELAISKINLDQSAEALETLAKARQKFSDTFLAEYCTALAYMHQKDYTNAVRYLTAAEVIAAATETNRLTHIFYFQLGSANERAGRWTEAVTYLERCLKISPDFAEALNYLGYMWAEKGTNLVTARQMIEQALKQEPDNAAYLDSLAWVFFKLGQPREALRQLQRAMDLSKEPDATLYDHLGDILKALNDPEKAREAWRKALSLEPTPELRKKLEPPDK
jgi:tetratricopeptide (TPR) repeat protein